MSWTNDKCPLCDKDFTFRTFLVADNRVAVHQDCVLRLIDKTAPAYLTDVAREALR